MTKNHQFLKGICYEPFPHGYDPSTANDTCIFYGSDIAGYNMRPLWGDSFTPVGGHDAGKMFQGRNDIANLAKLGVNLIRLYDWDSRNNHIPFLDYCWQFRIKVLVPVSNYNLGAFGTPPNMTASIMGLINSFKKNYDYHPAIYGILIGNEVDQLANVPLQYVIDYTTKWAEIESTIYPTFRKVRIGHPVSFATSGHGWSGDLPCFGYLDKLIPVLKKVTTQSLAKRLFICPNTYNTADYLYKDAQGLGEGWVDLAYNRYKLPMLFGEMGCGRMTSPEYLSVLQEQLEESLLFFPRNLKKLLGTCYFQYCDKVYKEGTTEGSFGLMNNTDKVSTVVRYGKRDFPDLGISCEGDKLNVQVLQAQPAYEVVKKIYKG